MRKFTLYWSSLAKYENCPQEFLWGRGWGDIDLGRGPGKVKKRPIVQADHHRVMGIVIQGVIEDFYNKELWKDPKNRANLAGMMEERTRSYFYRTVEKKRYGKLKFYIPYGQPDKYGRVPSQQELLDTCIDGVLGYLRTMKAHRLLGPYAQAEVDLIGYIDDYNPVGGRADLIIKRDDTGVSIIDGKNSKSKGKYTDPDQLRWYALCFYLAYNKLPDRLAFAYYRYPYDPETDEEGVDWVTATKDDIKGLARRAVDARKGMDKQQFDPTPSAQTCKFCDFETVCEARQSTKRTRKKKVTATEAATADLNGGFDLSFK